MTALYRLDAHHLSACRWLSWIVNVSNVAATQRYSIYLRCKNKWTDSAGVSVASLVESRACDERWLLNETEWIGVAERAQTNAFHWHWQHSLRDFCAVRKTKKKLNSIWQLYSRYTLHAFRNDGASLSSCGIGRRKNQNYLTVAHTAQQVSISKRRARPQWNKSWWHVDWLTLMAHFLIFFSFVVFPHRRRESFTVGYWHSWASKSNR